MWSRVMAASGKWLRGMGAEGDFSFISHVSDFLKDIGSKYDKLSTIINSG